MAVDRIVADCKAAVITGGTVYRCLFHGNDGTHRFGLTTDDCPSPWCRSPRGHAGDHDVPDGPLTVCEGPAGPTDLPHQRVRDGNGREWRPLGVAVREMEGVMAGG